MISNFFVISPRGDTIIAKDYRGDRGDVGAHERSHTEAFFRKIKFWDDMENGDNADEAEEGEAKRKANAPPVFIMPDGLSYCHVKRNGLIFGCATARNISPTTVIQVSSFFAIQVSVFSYLLYQICVFNFLFLATTNCDLQLEIIALVDYREGVQGLLRHSLRRSYSKELYPLV